MLPPLAGGGVRASQAVRTVSVSAWSTRTTGLLGSRNQRRVDAKLVRFQHCPATVIGSGSSGAAHISPVAGHAA